MSAGAQIDWFAQNAPTANAGGGDWFAANAPGSLDVSNPHGEGTYKMVGPQGQTLQVPFSKVRGAEDQRFQVVGGDLDRYNKDAAAAAKQPGLLDRLAQWGAETFPHTPSPYSAEHPATNVTDAVNDAFLRPATNVASAVARGALAIPAGVASAVEHVASPDAWTPAGTQRMRQQEIEAAQRAGQATVLAPGQTPPLPNADQTEEFADNAAAQAALTYGMGKAGAAALPATARVAGTLSAGGGPMEAAASVFARGVDEPMPGTTLTPRQRYLSAQNLGVKLDAADATNNPALRAAKAYNENSLLGSGTYEKNKALNQAALRDAIDGFLDSLYQGDRETGGNTIKNALRADQADLHETATGGFKQLTEATKGTPMSGAPDVGAHAKSLLDAITPLAERYPSLAPRKTIDVLNDLAGMGQPTPVPRTGFLDAPGSEFAVPQPRSSIPVTTFEDLQRLRAAVHDLTTTNPDLVKSQAIAPLQQMTAKLDEAMTNAENGLPQNLVPTFRGSNSAWADMKSTYDDPSSPLYHAVRTDNPSLLYNGQGLGPRTPEAVSDLSKRLTPEAMGALRRGVVESALKSTKDGSYNLKTFGTQWNRIPADYRAALFTTDQNAMLRDIANTSNLLAEDANPSGSAKMGQKMVEGAELLAAPAHPLGAMQAVSQYPLAKAMNSEALTDAIMRAGKRGASAAGQALEVPGAVAGAAAGAKGAPTQAATWQATGAEKLAKHAEQDPSGGISKADVDALAQTQLGRGLLMRASSLTPGSEAMKSLVKQVKTIVGN